MTEVERMTAEEVVGYLLEGEGVDVVRESLTWMCEQLMEAEVSELIGAGAGRAGSRGAVGASQWVPAQALGHACWRVGVGDPEDQAGQLFPEFFGTTEALGEPRKRSEQALVSVVREADVAGASTRRVDQVVESLGLRISKSEVSRICEGLDEHLDAFGNRPLEGAARICGSMRRSRRSVTAPGWCASVWYWPTGCTSPATGR